jgi:putative ABC transport system permease protein
MTNFWQDLRYGARMLGNRPVFAATAILTLALGIGANTAMFSVVRSVLLRPLPIPHFDRVVRVYMHFHPQDMDLGTMSDSDFRDWEAFNRSFESLGLFYNGATFELTGRGATELISGTYVTSGVFSTLQQRPLLGRVLLAQDDKPVVVLSEELWRRLFNSNPSAVGQSIDLGGRAFTIVGVMPQSFRFRSDKDELWANYLLDPSPKRGPWFSYGIARLKPGVTLEQAQAEVNELGKRIEQAYPTTYSNLTLPLLPFRESIVGDVRSSLLLMFGAVFLVLLIAVVNVSNLLFVHSSSRHLEIAIRRSLGAGRLQIALQLFTESTLLALIGGVLGLYLGYGCVELLRVWNPGSLSHIQDIHLDGTVMTFTCFVTLGAWILCSLGPAVQASQVDLISPLKAEGHTANSESRRTHSVLAVSEIALSVVLLVGAGLLLHSFIQLQKVNAGFQAPPQNVLAAKFSVTTTKPFDSKAWLATYERVLEKIQNLPGVTSAALSKSIPPNGGCGCSPFTIEGQAWSPNAYPSFPYVAVSDDYFSSLAIPLLKGRYFTRDDRPDSRKVAIISDSLARRYFPNQDPIGKRIRLGVPEDVKWPYAEIVGVVGDVKYLGLARPPEPAFYVPLTQDVNPVFLVVRSTVSAASVAQEVRAAIKSIGNDVIFIRMNTMEELVADSVAPPRVRTVLLGTFASVALLLAAIGVYGVLAYSVAQRRTEIGIRVALGAQRQDILWLVVGRGLQLTLVGLAIGTVGSLALAFALRGLLFQVKPADPVTFIGVGVVLLFAAVVACYVPARRAARVDPLITLHYE